MPTKAREAQVSHLQKLLRLLSSLLEEAFRTPGIRAEEEYEEAIKETNIRRAEESSPTSPEWVPKEIQHQQLNISYLSCLIYHWSSSPLMILKDDQTAQENNKWQTTCLTPSDAQQPITTPAVVSTTTSFYGPSPSSHSKRFRSRSWIPLANSFRTLWKPTLLLGEARRWHDV